MHPHDIEALLKKAGYKQTNIAQELNVPRSTIYAVLHGRGRSRQVEDRIAAITGLAPEVLWPQWYGPDVPARVMVLGHSNVAAGRDLVGNHVREPAASYGDPAEERMLRLYRALEPAQRDELERIARKMIAGG